MTQQEIKQSYGVCGLVCAFCNYNSDCTGCRCKPEDCDIKKCCREKGYDYCFECKDYPCDKDMHKSLRLQAFNTVAKNEGLDKLAEYLFINFNRGISYHRADKLTGDYDKCRTAGEVTDLLKNGKPNPYDTCPTYESKTFILRLIKPDDASDLLSCYGNPAAQKIFNSDNCTSNFRYSTLNEMKNCIESWLTAYKNKHFVRFSIIDKQTEKAVGTVEIFGSDKNTGHSVLRIDIHPQYENREYIGELLYISDSFFDDFSCYRMIVKAIPEASERISALVQNGYVSYPKNDKWELDHYYIKRRS